MLVSHMGKITDSHNYFDEKYANDVTVFGAKGLIWQESIQT